MKLPWAAKNGSWNPDMFYDWYRNNPTSAEEERLWDFLHDWDKERQLQVVDEVMAKVEQVIKKEYR